MRRLICACLAMLLILLCVGVWALFETARTVQAIGATVQAVPALVDRHADKALAAAVGEIRAARVDLKGEVGAARQGILQRVDKVAELVDVHAAEIEAAAVNEIRATRADVMQTVRPVAGEFKGLVAAYGKLPADVGARLDPWTDCRGNGACWQAQFTAVLGASRATLGQVARSAPSIAASMERSALSTETATAATASAMNNLAELSRPLPRWMRVPLQIMGPSAPLWVPFLGR